MKKILLASSALVLVGGAAFAEVTLSGSAEMGFWGGDYTNNVKGPGELKSEKHNMQYWTDLDIDFTLSGTTEGGVEFGASIDLDDAAEGGNAGMPETEDGDFAVFVSGDFGTLTMGDTDGALDWALQDNNFGMSGSLMDNEEHLGYSGMSLLDGFYDGQIARYDYSFGDFAFAVSAELDDTSDRKSDSSKDFDEPMMGIGARYNLDLASGSILFGAAYQGTEDLYIAGITGAATFGDLQAGLAYFAGEVNGMSAGLNDDGTNIELSVSSADATKKNLEDIEFFGGSVAYTFDAITVGVNAGTYDHKYFKEAWGWGITAGYDLGGGLELQAGYGYSEAKSKNSAPIDKVDADVYTYSLGLAMAF